MRGIEGNFMAQPRVFAHSAVPVDIGSPIAGTEERGCALYVGTGGTLVSSVPIPPTPAIRISLIRRVEGEVSSWILEGIMEIAVQH